MKKQIFNQKISVFIFIVVLLVYGIDGIVYARLEFEEGAETVREIAENTANRQNIGLPLRYSAEDVEGCIDIWLRGPDAKSFAICLPFRGGIQLKTKSALNYEKKNSYKVTLSITDMENPESYDVICVRIFITNVNETPVFSEEMVEAAVNRVHRSIPENTPVGIDIGPPVSATDPDGSEVVLTYMLSGYDADMFEIITETGQLCTKMPLDYEAFEREPRTYFVDVEVSDGVTTATTEVWIDVEPVNEFAPMFIDGDTTTREIISTEEIGVNIGSPVSAIEFDAGETLEYTLSNDETGAFEIDSKTGQLRNRIELDYKTKPEHTLKAIVSDGTYTDSIIVTIQVLSDIVDIPDRSLAWVIRKTLGLGADADITMRELLKLTSLHAPNQRFVGRPVPSNLTGLEYAKNLRQLNLNGNSIADLTPIAGLTNLISLRLYSNNFSSLIPLRGLKSLKSLDISANGISDISSLTSLTNLVELFLQLNKIEDVTPLKGMTNLELLYLSENNVEDIKALAGLTNLTQLYLQANSLQDITPLEGCVDLETLYLSSNDIVDISPLEDLTSLKYLHLSYNRNLSNVSPLAGLENLEILRLFGCPITDFTPLEGLTADIDVHD